MEEPGAPPNPNPTQPSLCDECGRNPWKYRCPGCSIRTCSLPCVNSHKQRTSCTGQKNRTQIVPISQFDDNLLISDYHFLEEAKRVVESAHRMRGRFGGHSGFYLPFTLRMLRNAAYHRKTRLMFLPDGMSKRDKNQSRFDQRSKSIFWTIEWRFHPSNIVLIDHGVDERMCLISIVEKHLRPGPWNHQLRPFCNEQLDSLKFFLKKNPKGPKSPFREINIKVPIGQQMANISIIEYPVIDVFLPTHCRDFEVEKDEKTFSKREPAESLDNIPSPKGILFREEEIEEVDASSDTQIMDLMDYMNSESGDKFQIPRDITIYQKAATLSDVETSMSVAESSNLASGNKSVAYSSLKLSVGTDFNFEQGLRDAYSELIGEMNPDDFLCLDGEEGEAEERNVVHSDFGGELIAEDELEEGEIPSY